MEYYREVPLFNVTEYSEFDWSVSFYILDTWDKQLEIDCNYMHTSPHKKTRMAGCSASIHSKAGEGRQRTTISSHTARS